jgi:hypothetical protein
VLRFGVFKVTFVDSDDDDEEGEEEETNDGDDENTTADDLNTTASTLNDTSDMASNMPSTSMDRSSEPRSIAGPAVRTRMCYSKMIVIIVNDCRQSNNSCTPSYVNRRNTLDDTFK